MHPTPNAIAQPLQPRRQPGPPAELPTAAPLVGDIRTMLRPKLDGNNLWRLPSLTADAGQLGPFWVAAASLAGLGHLHHGRTGQDSFSFALTDDQAALVVGVADGLGSRPDTAQIGAVVAARLLCHELARHHTDVVLDPSSGVVDEAVRAVNGQLTQICRRLVRELCAGDLATTIVVCVVPTDPLDCRRVLVRVGDCAAFVLSDGHFVPVFVRDGGPLNRVSSVLPVSGDSTTALRAEISRLDARDGAVVLVTDGVAEDIHDSPTVRAWLAERWSEPCSLTSFIDALRYRRQGSHDDRTALIVWPPASVGLATGRHSEPPAEPGHRRSHVGGRGALFRRFARPRRRQVRPWSDGRRGGA